MGPIGNHQVNFFSPRVSSCEIFKGFMSLPDPYRRDQVKVVCIVSISLRPPGRLTQTAWQSSEAAPSQTLPTSFFAVAYPPTIKALSRYSVTCLRAGCYPTSLAFGARDITPLAGCLSASRARCPKHYPYEMPQR